MMAVAFTPCDAMPDVLKTLHLFALAKEELLDEW